MCGSAVGHYCRLYAFVGRRVSGAALRAIRDSTKGWEGRSVTCKQMRYSLAGLRRVAQWAVQQRPDARCATLRTLRPLADLPRRIVTHVLSVTARELRDPLPLIIRP